MTDQIKEFLKKEIEILRKDIDSNDLYSQGRLYAYIETLDVIAALEDD